MATVADLNARMDLAVSAIDAESWSVAERHLMAAKAMLAALPSGAASGYVTTWNASAIDDLLDRVRRKAVAETTAATAAGGVIQRSSIVAQGEGGSCGCT